MIFTSNTSQLIPFQFPDYYRENSQTLVTFLQEYFKWMEQANNANYFARRIYQIKDIDTTFNEFLIYFKEKYLKKITFDTHADIRTVIKHALDIYRSKGTERCATLLFQLAFNKKPEFYYPSTDLFRLDDGEFVYPYYLELSLNWEYNSQLQQKEVVGLFSGARAFVDSIVRRKTNSRLEDIAYISAVFGTFQVGEKLKPMDNSLEIEECPTIQGSLNSINMLQQGSGTGYVVGSLVPASSTYGNGAIVQALESDDVQGVVELSFVDGGYGYQVNAVQATLHLTSLTGSFAVNDDVFTYYGNGSIMGEGTVISANSTVLVANVLSGNLNNTVGKVFSVTNTSFANISTYSANTYGPDILISNATMTISDMIMNTSNLEYIHYFNWLETITEPLATIDYISATVPFVVGDNVFTYFANNSVDGSGRVIASETGSSNTGTIIVSVVSGNLHSNDRFYTTANAGHANTNIYTDSTATGVFIANSSSVTLNLDNVVGTFLHNEEIFQNSSLSSQVVEEKFGGWGTLSTINTSNTITCNMVEGRIIQGPIIGLSSLTTANVVSVKTNIGVINTSGQFLASPYAYVYSGLCSGYLTDYNESGTDFTVSILPTIDYSENVSIPIDKIYLMGNVQIGATSYGLPANPAANGSTKMPLTWSYAQTTIGKLNSVLMTGSGSNFTDVPYIVINNPGVSVDAYYDAIIQITGATGSFANGEIITQAATNAKGEVLSANALFVTVLRLSYANNFIPTTNSTTTILGVSSGAVANVVAVDYDIFSPVMGRNATTEISFTTGNNVLTRVGVVDSGFGFINGDVITIGSNGAVGTAVLGGLGTGSGFYLTKGGFLDDVKKLYDGWFYQNFSYQVVSPLMLNKYKKMLEDITHISGTLMFGRYVHTAVVPSSVNFNNADINIT